MLFVQFEVAKMARATTILTDTFKSFTKCWNKKKSATNSNRGRRCKFFLETHAPTDGLEGGKSTDTFFNIAQKRRQNATSAQKEKKLNGDACLLSQLCANWQNMVGWL